jgi:cell surface protein SprA
VTYNIPINKIPVLDWVSANARYTTNYNWKASAQSEEAVSIGNLASNYQTYQGNATLNFQSFYNKLSYLEKVNKRSMSKAKKDAKTKAVKWEDKDIKLRKKRNTSFEHDLKTTDIDVKVFDAKGALVDGKVKIIDKNKVQFLADTTLENVTVLITGNVSEKPDMGILFSDGILNLGMLLKNVSVSYSENNGSELPGYMPSTQYMGLGQFNNQWAPGWPFVLGWQDDNFAYTAAQNQWLSTDTLQTQPFVMTHQTNLNVRATLEPFPEFRIDVTANKTTSENDAQIFYPTNAEKYLYEVQSKLISGNYQITFGSIRTAFKRPDASTYRSEVFEQFRQYRQIIAWRLAGERTDASYDAYAPNIDSETQLARKDGYPNGYSPNSQDVLIPALIAAYSGSKPQTVGLDPFSQIPFPNWRLTYDGLTRIPFLARFFKKISLAHGYNSVFSVGSYRLDASEHDFYRGDDGYSYVRDILEGYFMPEKEVSNVTISEKFSPLISVDVNFDFGLTARFETRKSRNISLSLSNNQLIEMITDELIFGAGWRIEDLPINISVGGKSTGFKSDLNIRADFAIRDNMTIIHKLDQNADQITAGQKNTSIKLSADYNLSEKFNLRFYYDQTINAPRVSTSWRTSNTQVGFSLRFTII